MMNFTGRSWVLGVLLLLLACDENTTSDRITPRREIHVTPEEDPTQRRTDEPDPAGEARRAASITALRSLGFRPADWLPTTRRRADIGGNLRPADEIARRLMALHALNLWVFANDVPDRDILDYVEANGLRSGLTNDELTILEASRDGIDDRYGGQMGWTQENMWPLAWALGFDLKPTPEAGLIDDAVVGRMLDFLPGLDGRVRDLVQTASARSEADILDLEDLFYCAHNAARSAQLGESGVVPIGFHPIRNGGAVHERRHALTWMISPGTSWEDTDLST